jgi:hypothetical protein
VSSIKLQEMFDTHVGMYLTRMCAFGDTVESPFWKWWQSDEDGTSHINFPDLGQFEMQVLGSECFVSDTWLSAWANKDHSVESVQVAKELKKFGEDMDDERIGGDYFPLDVINGDYIGTIAAGMYQNSSCICVPTLDPEGKQIGQTFMLFFDVPLINIDPIPQHRMRIVMQMMQESTQVGSYDNAVLSYIKEAGFSLAESNESDGTKTEIYRDDHGRQFTLAWKEKQSKTHLDKEFSVACNPTAEGFVKPIERPPEEVEKQWNWFVRAPLSRQIAQV